MGGEGDEAHAPIGGIVAVVVAVAAGGGGGHVDGLSVYLGVGDCHVGAVQHFSSGRQYLDTYIS